jgi:amidase
MKNGWTAPNDPLGAFCRDNHIAVKGSGTGPLAGLTFAAKDAFHVKGARTGFGQPDWLRTHDPATETADAVQKVLDAGADMVAKTHCDELCYSLTGENVHFGTPVNVNAPGRVPGGSSNGSAAAVAGELVDFAIGTDCGGSVRIPASYCGIIGLRPTHGRVSDKGALPFGPSFDVVGWFARDIDLFAKVGDVLLGEGTSEAPARLIIADDAWEQVETPVADALKAPAAKVESVLGKAAHVRVSPEGLDEWFEVFRTLQAAEIWATLGDWVTKTQPKFGPGTKERFAYAATITPDQVKAANARRREITAHVDELLGVDGVICLPTSPRVAPLRGTPADKVEVEYRNQAQRILCIAGLCGLPQISLPMASIDGLPLGLSLMGARHSDQALIALAKRVLS